jgi:putative endonuclease
MKKTGDLGEKLAAEFLESKGFTILERNWRGIKGMRAPEIDLIARDGETLAFVEVKTTGSDQFGPPQEWITREKQQRLTRAAATYLALNRLSHTACRFDAILVDIRLEPPRITHIPNAFSASDTE